METMPLSQRLLKVEAEMFSFFARRPMGRHSSAISSRRTRALAFWCFLSHVRSSWRASSELTRRRISFFSGVLNFFLAGSTVFRAAMMVDP